MSFDENGGDDFRSWFEACREVAKWMGEYRCMEGHPTTLERLLFLPLVKLLMRDSKRGEVWLE